MNTIVTDFLDELNIPYKIKDHTKPVFTSEEAAEERGVRLSQIVKTMLLTDKDDMIVMAVLPANRKVDLKKLRRLSGYKNLDFMDKEAIEKKTKLVVGAIAPIGKILKGVPTFVDPSVFNEEFLDISSGVPNAGLELQRDVLKGLLKKAIVTDITKEEK